MAPTWVLLGRRVDFAYDAAVFGGAREEEGRGKKPRMSEGGGGMDEPLPLRFQEMMEAQQKQTTAYLKSLKPDAHVADLPQVSSLRLLRPTKFIPPLALHASCCYVASADKNLVALYAGTYCAGRTPLFLIYDAESNSLSSVPGVDVVSRDRCGAVVLRDGAGYALAELVMILDSGPAEARLLLWRSSAAKWVIKAGRPLLGLPPNRFRAAMCFSSGGSILCWADPLQGMVVCNLQEQEHKSDPGFRFIPLPDECPTFALSYPPKQAMGAAFRSMACVAGGAIKFVTMEGYGEGRPGEEMTLTMWTLSADLCHWKKGKQYNVRDIWESESHRALGLPRIIPVFPVLSMDEEDVVYLVVTHLRMLEDGYVEFKAQYLLRVDMGHQEVKHLLQSTEEQIHPNPFATEFSAYLQEH